MEARVSEILENILSLLNLEGSFDIEEKEDGIFVQIDTEDAGRLIGSQGETLQALQLIVNLIASRQIEESKRVIIDVSGWKKNKEEDIAERAKSWVEEVKESKESMALDPMPAWQRRIVHMVVQESAGVKSESVGEGIERHLVISPE
jgi:spoIIIJ-associated protein